MFRPINSRISNRVEKLKSKTQEQAHLEKNIREFLVEEFGVIGQTLEFSCQKEKKKLQLWLVNKTAGNELILRSRKLADFLKSKSMPVEIISIG